MDSFTPGRFVLEEGVPLTLLNKRLCGPQSRSGHFRNEQFPCPCRASNHNFLYFTPTELFLQQHLIERLWQIWVFD